MQIKVNHLPSTYVLNEFYEFVCPHINVEVEPPCCSFPDNNGLWSCGCYGQPQIYCPDCNNSDVFTDDFIDELL